MAADEVTIERVGPERIEAMKPLYEALHEHHAEIRPALAGGSARGAEESWQRRRRRYEEWLARPGAFALLAARDGEAVGYAVVTIEDGYDSWNAGERVGDVHDIALLPEARGAGLGTALLARVTSELVSDGIGHYRLLALDGNDDAVRFYERAGMETVVHQMLGRTS